MTAGALAAVTAGHVADIAREVWSCLLGLELQPLGDDAVRSPEGDGLCGVVGISGAWQGSVALECPAAQARAAAAVMLAAEPSSLSADEVADAVGELTNLVGGKIKYLLPAPSALSVPSVTATRRVPVPRPQPAQRVHLVPFPAPDDGQPIRITVWTAEPGHAPVLRSLDRQPPPTGPDTSRAQQRGSPQR